MLYMLLIHADEAIWTQHSEAEQAAVMKQHEALELDLRKAGKYKACAGLAPKAAATTLRHKGSDTFVTDGPFAEAKEQFGGYYLVDAKDLDDAIDIAKRIPVTPEGAIEIRPVAVESLVDPEAL